MRIELPWPPSVLSPNNRKHWTVKAKAKKQYRSDCYYLTHNANVILPPGDYNLKLIIMFHPPSKRSFDTDNMLARLKSGIDGVADALGVNDKRFRPITIDIGAPVKGGMVVLTVGEK